MVKTTMSFPSAYYLCRGKMMIASIKSDYGKWETSKPVMIRKKIKSKCRHKGETSVRKSVKNSKAKARHAWLELRL
ncbi:MULTISPECIES: hypothetical protein [Bacteroides]|uniref:hypothetical protein n=1 Tax=Bacteroides TaxID=816 RepID=UPI00257C6841|nr:hypothetical protein [Bacteroides sp.]